MVWGGRIQTSRSNPKIPRGGGGRKTWIYEDSARQVADRVKWGERFRSPEEGIRSYRKGEIKKVRAKLETRWGKRAHTRDRTAQTEKRPRADVGVGARKEENNHWEREGRVKGDSSRELPTRGRSPQLGKTNSSKGGRKGGETEPRRRSACCSRMARTQKVHGGGNE